MDGAAPDTIEPGAPRRFALMVCCSPWLEAPARNAVAFARAALEAGHRIECVFFYQHGAGTALSSLDISSDDFDPRPAWRSLSSQFGVPLTVCVGSAQRRGISDEAGNVADGFTIAGLGAWLKAVAAAERVVRFR